MILIVEDNKTWQEIYGRLFPQIDIIFCRDGIEAIKIIDQKIPQLIILDIFLNGPNAFALLNELQSYPNLAQIPIFIISDTDLSQYDLSAYNIIRIFSKATLDPRALQNEVNHYA